MKVSYIWEEEFNSKDKRLWIAEDHFNFAGKYRDATDCICHLKYTVPFLFNDKKIIWKI